MSTEKATSEYLVLSRGTSWDKSLSPEDIQNALDQFNAWFERLSDEGNIKSGYRLAPDGKVLPGRKAVVDGPFAESKEAIAGYWFIRAASLKKRWRSPKPTPVWTTE